MRIEVFQRNQTLPLMYDLLPIVDGNCVTDIAENIKGEPNRFSTLNQQLSRVFPEFSINPLCVFFVSVHKPLRIPVHPPCLNPVMRPIYLLTFL